MTELLGTPSLSTKTAFDGPPARPAAAPLGVNQLNQASTFIGTGGGDG